MLASFITVWMVLIASIKMLGDTTMHLGAMGLLDQLLKIGMQIGIDRFRRHEHDGRGLHLAGDQIFLGNVADMLGDIALDPRHRRFLFFVIGGLAQQGERFQRKFGVNHQQRLRCRECG